MANELVIASRDDLNELEKQNLEQYIQNGCPGLTSLEDTQVFKWFELYMSGKTYSEIAVISKSKKDLIVYVAYKSKWLEKRNEYFTAITQNMTVKLTNIRTESINTMATIVSSLNKYFGKKFDNYLATNDDSIIENMDSKVLEKYYKSLEILEKVMNPTNKDPKEPPLTHPPININIGNGANVQQTSGSSMDIDIKDEPNDLLRKLSQQKKEQQLKK
jgi:hypothetical protein